MKTYAPIISVILLLSLLGNWLQWRGRKSEDLKAQIENSQLRTRVAQNAAVAKTARARGDSLQKVHTDDSLKFESHKTAFTKEIQKKDKTISALRVPVQPMLDSVPALKAFVQAQDDAIHHRDSVNSFLTGRLYEVGKSFTAQLFEKDVEIRALTSMNQDFQKELIITQGQVRAEKRKVKFWKIAAGVITVGAVYLIAKD